MKKTMLTFIAAAAVVVFGAGCNTVHGLGKDIEKGGEAIQRSTK
ncbi:MAG TPA: entericidin A/B family lipoprotein [Rhodocyclaceae bacterium]|nr:entericidin A/B family lipoprotein [Zoogloeaceae bacterium]HRD34235.1 entericidin A/B family lipoprotein [Rhodocyclaceae bacterium]